MRLFFRAAAAAALIAEASGGAAQSDVAPPPVIKPVGLPEGARIDLPFAPPLGTELHYKFFRADENQGETKTVRNEIGLTFERRGPGYRMTMRVTFPGIAPGLRARPEIRMLEIPVTFRLSASGEVVGMEDEDSYWRRIFDLIERDPAFGAGDPAMMKRLMDGMRRLPDAERMALLARNILPVLELAGSDMAVGETRKATDEQGRLPLADIAKARIRREIALTLDHADEMSASFTSSVTHDPESLRAAFAELAALAPPERRAEVANPPRLKLSERGQYKVSRSTGLASFYMHWVRAEGAPEGTAMRVVTIEAIPGPSR